MLRWRDRYGRMGILQAMNKPRLFVNGKLCETYTDEQGFECYRQITANGKPMLIVNGEFCEEIKDSFGNTTYRAIVMKGSSKRGINRP